MECSKGEEAVREAKGLLKRLGRECSVGMDEMTLYFSADTPYPDITLDKVLEDPLLVAHELVEIDAIVRSGLELTKDVIMKHYAAVDEAHIEAAGVELDLAAMLGMKDRVERLHRLALMWRDDPLTTKAMAAKYEELRLRAGGLLTRL